VRSPEKKSLLAPAREHAPFFHRSAGIRVVGHRSACSIASAITISQMSIAARTAPTKRLHEAGGNPQVTAATQASAPVRTKRLREQVRQGVLLRLAKKRNERPVKLTYGQQPRSTTPRRRQYGNIALQRSASRRARARSAVGCTKWPASRPPSATDAGQGEDRRRRWAVWKAPVIGSKLRHSYGQHQRPLAHPPRS